MKQIVVINQALSNHGDEAAHKGLIRMLAHRYPQAKISVLVHVDRSCQKENYALFHPVELPHIQYTRLEYDKWYNRIIRYLWWLPPIMLNLVGPYISISFKHVKQMLGSADLVINAPGGVDLGPYRNWSNVVRLNLSLRSGGKTAIFGISFGPMPEQNFKDRCFSRLALRILRRVDFLSLRDDQSQQYARNIGINYVPTADTALLDVTQVDTPSELEEIVEKPYVVFVPNELYRWHPHFQAISKETFDQLYREIIKLFSTSGRRILMLPQLFGKQDDETFFRKLSAGFPSSQITLVPSRYSSEVQEAIIRRAVMVVGARYHSVVFSIKNHTPFFALSYEHKIFNLLTIAKLEDLAFDLNNVNTKSSQSICRQIDSILQHLDVTKNRVAKGHQLVCNIAQAASEEFFCRFTLAPKENEYVQKEMEVASRGPRVFRRGMDALRRR